jgi:hypothetical protein
MKTGLIIKYVVAALLLAGSGWISCGQGKDDPAEIEDKPDDGVKIENLQTRLRIIDPGYLSRESIWKYDLKDSITGKNMWRWDPKNVIIHFPPLPKYYRIDTYFGYADADGRTLLCEVINFPEVASQWKEDFSSGLGTLSEVNVQMSGTVRLYTDNTGEKYGLLELTSLEPVGAEPANLQLGVYTETYPGRGKTLINFIDKETLEITQIYDKEIQTDKWKYEIRDNYTVRLTEDGEAIGGELFFRVISDSKFEMDYIYVVTAENLPPIMTFEKENNQHSNK